MSAALLAAEHVEECSAEACAQKAVDERVDRRVGEAKNLQAEPNDRIGKARIRLSSQHFKAPFSHHAFYFVQKGRKALRAERDNAFLLDHARLFCLRNCITFSQLL